MIDRFVVTTYGEECLKKAVHTVNGANITPKYPFGFGIEVVKSDHLPKCTMYRGLLHHFLGYAMEGCVVKKKLVGNRVLGLLYIE